MAFLYILIIILACVVLVKSTYWVISALNYLAKYLRIPEFVAAFILAGIATSFPEIFVGISSAINNTPILSLSNVFGSNIANITLVLGLTVVLIKGLGSGSRIVERNIIYVAILIVYSILLASDGLLSRIDGIGLIILFILYNLILFFQSKDFTKTAGWARKKDLVKNLLLFAGGIFLLVISSEVIVRASSGLGAEINISLFLIGLFLVAIGTSLPELIFGIRAAAEQHREMILGNILGSLATNATVVLGITAIISPIIINDRGMLISSSIFLLAAYVLFLIFTRTKKRISRKEGMVLLSFYIIFIIVQFSIG